MSKITKGSGADPDIASSFLWYISFHDVFFLVYLGQLSCLILSLYTRVCARARFLQLIQLLYQYLSTVSLFNSLVILYVALPRALGCSSFMVEVSCVYLLKSLHMVVALTRLGITQALFSTCCQFNKINLIFYHYLYLF